MGIGNGDRLQTQIANSWGKNTEKGFWLDLKYIVLLRPLVCRENETKVYYYSCLIVLFVPPVS